MRTLSVQAAVELIPDGASVMIGGFMGVGTPERLVDELVRQKKRDLTVIANDNALPGTGIGKLVSAGVMRKTIASHIGLNPETQKKMLAGALEVELVPQGTLVERIRAAGYGLGGVLTPTGVGTVVEEGKQRIEVDGKPYLLEKALATVRLERSHVVPSIYHSVFRVIGFLLRRQPAAAQQYSPRRAMMSPGMRTAAVMVGVLCLLAATVAKAVWVTVPLPDRVQEVDLIVVGQLQHRGEIAWANLRKMLVPVREIVSQTALTDGWGTALPIRL